MATFIVTRTTAIAIIDAARAAVIDPSGDYKDAAAARAAAIVEAFGGMVPLGMPDGAECPRAFGRWLGAVHYMSMCSEPVTDDSTWTEGTPECGLDE